MAKLNPNAQKWVDALRSGKYRQGQCQLSEIGPEGARHCCLGVLCEVAMDAKVIGRYKAERSYLPERVMVWAGLKTEKANFRESNAEENSEGGTLVQLNDRGESFAKIADFIEAHAEELGVSA